MATLMHSDPTLSLPQTALPRQESDPRFSDTAQYLGRLHEYVFEAIESLRLSQIKAFDSDFAALAVQLEELKNLPEGWDGYSAPEPTPQVIEEARQILDGLQEALMKPYWISASADGGVAFSFAASNERRAQIEILNSGEKFAHLYDLNGNSHTETWAENPAGETLRQLLEPISNYIRS